MSKRWAFVIDGTNHVLLANSSDGVQAMSLANRYIVISCDGSWHWQCVDLVPAESVTQEPVEQTPGEQP